MRESKIEQHFVKAVTAAGGMTRKAKWLCRRGCPDRFWAFLVTPSRSDGRFLKVGTLDAGHYGFAEIKAPGEKLDAHQQRERDRLTAMGVPVLVFDSIAGVDAWVAGMRG